MAKRLPPEDLYTAAQVRELDRRAIEGEGIPAQTLMAHAGEAAFALLRTRWPRARQVLVVCGSGNNGGDGYVVARRALESGLTPLVLAIGRPREGAAHAAFEQCARAGVEIWDFDRDLPVWADVIVDALLGTGLTRAVEGAYRAAIETMNQADRPILAVDVPSGLNADTGAVMGASVRAEATITFIGAKVGLYTGAGRHYAGQIYFDDLEVPDPVYRAVVPAARRIMRGRLATMLVPRARHGHKGDYGHVLIIGGGEGMPGAARLAGEAAYRAGAGLVTVAAHPASVAAIPAARPELIARVVTQAADLGPLFRAADVVAVGPGLGRGVWSQRMLAAALEADRPLVVDADALNLLATEPERRADWVLTPHPGEAARLLGCGANDVQADRPGAVRALTERFGGTIVLKGSGTLVRTDGRELALCDLGNPGMASGGMGDVLTGIIAALIAQGMAPYDAACTGVWVHAAAGDDAAARSGEAGLLASDLFEPLRVRLNALRHGTAHARAS